MPIRVMTGKELNTLGSTHTSSATAALEVALNELEMEGWVLRHVVPAHDFEDTYGQTVLGTHGAEFIFYRSSLGESTN